MEPCRGRLLAYGSCSYSDVCQGAQIKCVIVQTKTRSPPVLGTDTTKLALKGISMKINTTFKFSNITSEDAPGPLAAAGLGAVGRRGTLWASPLA